MTKRLPRRFLGVWLIALAGLFSGCSGLSNGPKTFASQTVSFESGDIGKSPRDFATALTGGGGPVSWIVRENSELPGDKPILVQESADPTSYRFPVCIYEKTLAQDVAAEVKWKAISGKVDQAGGIVLRYEPDNYYVARANALEDNVILFKMVEGKRSKVKVAPVKVTGGRWHTLRFEAKGSHLRIVFDGTSAIDTEDDTFIRPGKVGLWTKADSVSAFTGLTIEPAP